MCHVMLYKVCPVMLCYITCVMLCYVTCVMLETKNMLLYNVCHVINIKYVVI